jgi:1-deoxy-D-xylulose-5-phosphate reductoisomerase
MVSKRIALLGATGSIGTSTLEVAQEQGISIAFASAHTDYNKLIAIAYKHHIPKLVLTGIGDQALINKLKQQNPSLGIFAGENELLNLLCGENYDIALNAITGSAGLRSSFCIMQRGKTLALANKESLVMAGHLLTRLVEDKPIIPVDSEHSAIFQCIGMHPHNQIRQLHITASGGAFRDLPLSEFSKISPQEALTHPNWSMGAKVTLDSATMFNKALEVIEAHWLFGLPYAQISAIMHPQSIIHSLVEFVDGSFLAQLSTPDMKLPILYALSYPERVESQLVKTDLTKLGNLNFREIEPQRYPLFYLGLEAANIGGLMPTVMNAAVEAASAMFLNGNIGFTDISDLVKKALDNLANISEPDLETIIHTNSEVYKWVLNGCVKR